MKKFIFHIAEKSLRESVPTVTKDRSSCESRRLAQDSGTNSKMLGCDRVPINRDRDGSSQSQKLRKRDISFDVCSPNNGRFFYAPKPDRIAISALCQYNTVIAIGLSLLFKVLWVHWAKLGWIAAALSVGSDSACRRSWRISCAASLCCSSVPSGWVISSPSMAPSAPSQKSGFVRQRSPTRILRSTNAARFSDAGQIKAIIYLFLKASPAAPPK